MRHAVDTKPTSSDHPQNLRFIYISLRLCVVPFTVASLWMMAKNKQTNDVYGKVEFSNISGLKYLVCINAISAGYALVGAIFSYFRCFNNDWIVFILDQAIAYLMVTSGSAVAEVLYLAHEGDREVSWSQACDSYGMFCSRVKVSLVLHFTALACFIAVSLISAYKLFSKFEPPSAPSKEVGEQGYSQAMNN